MARQRVTNAADGDSPARRTTRSRWTEVLERARGRTSFARRILAGYLVPPLLFVLLGALHFAFNYEDPESFNADLYKGGRDLAAQIAPLLEVTDGQDAPVAEAPAHPNLAGILAMCRQPSAEPDDQPCVLAETIHDENIKVARLYDREARLLEVLQASPLSDGDIGDLGIRFRLLPSVIAPPTPEIEEAELPTGRRAVIEPVVREAFSWFRALASGGTPRSDQPDGSQIRAALDTGESSATERHDQAGTRWVDFAAPILPPDSGLVQGVIVVSREGNEIAELTRYFQLLFAVFLLSLVPVCIWTWWNSERVTRPIAALAEYARNTGVARPARPDTPADSFPGVERQDQVGELARALQAASRKVRDRIDRSDSFNTVAVHQTLTPAINVKSFARAILDDNLSLTPEERTEYLTIIRDNADSLVRILQQMHDYARKEADTLKAEWSLFDLVKMTQDAVNVHCDRENRCRVALESTPPANPVEVHGPDKLVSSAIFNLIHNAIRFSPENATVLVRLSLSDEGSAIVLVDDEGEGVPEDTGKREQMFWPKYSRQLAEVAATGVGGRPSDNGAAGTGDNLGVGLSLARSIFERMDGRIWAENRYRNGKISGARFGVELPIGRGPLPSRADTSPA